MTPLVRRKSYANLLRDPFRIDVDNLGAGQPRPFLLPARLLAPNCAALRNGRYHSRKRCGIDRRHPPSPTP